MSDTLPMFPLGTVLFPGVSVPLHVFEDRYRAMVHHLLRVPDPVDRVFGSVAIREGYEIGDHGNQSLYRVGCRIRMTEVESHPDGTFDLVGVGLDRIALDRLDTRGPYPVGHVTARPDATDPVPEDVVEQARVMFTAYRSALAQVRGDLLPAELPRGPDVPLLDAGGADPAPDARPAVTAGGRGRGRAAAAGHRPAARRAARHERHPVAPGHRAGAHPLVAELAATVRGTSGVAWLMKVEQATRPRHEVARARRNPVR